MRDYWQDIRTEDDGRDNGSSTPHFFGSKDANNRAVSCGVALISPSPETPPGSTSIPSNAQLYPSGGLVPGLNLKAGYASNIESDPFTPTSIANYRTTPINGSTNPPFNVEATTAQLSSLRQNYPQAPSTLNGTNNVENENPYKTAADVFKNIQLATPELSEDTLGDGIFLPGSTYHELHMTLRNRIFDTARSNWETWLEAPRSIIDFDRAPFHRGIDHGCAPITVVEEQDSNSASHRVPELSPLQEYELWKNHTEEVAPWVRFYYCLFLKPGSILFTHNISD